MSYQNIPIQSAKTSLARQSGTALIVSLIILAMVTLLGMTSMQSSSTELKLAATMRDRGVAFEAVEAALAIVETNLATDAPDRAKLFSTCAGAGCFNKNCDGGLCFGGSYALTDSEFACEVANYADTARRTEYWSDKTLNIWKTASKYKTITIDNLTTDVKYIVEFLCYVPRDDVTPFSVKLGENNNGAPLFRITAMAEGNGERATVALQSTYKVLNGQ